MCAITFPFDQNYFIKKHFPGMKKVALRDVCHWSRSVCNGCLQLWHEAKLTDIVVSASLSFWLEFCYLRMKYKDEVMSPASLVLGFFCSLVSVRESSLSMSDSTWATTVVSSHRDLNWEVQIWLWIFSPKNQCCSDVELSLVWSQCKRGQSWYTTKSLCLLGEQSNPSDCNMWEMSRKE